MALESQQSVVPDHAATVVSDLNEFLSPGFDLNFDAGGTGVERIFQQFLDDRSRTLYHFAGGDFVGNVFGKDVDFAHGRAADSNGHWSARSVSQMRRREAKVSNGEIGGSKQGFGVAQRFSAAIG